MFVGNAQNIAMGIKRTDKYSILNHRFLCTSILPMQRYVILFFNDLYRLKHLPVNRKVFFYVD